MVGNYKHRKIFALIICVILLLGFINNKKIGRHFFTMKYEEEIRAYSLEYGLDPLLVASIIRAESNFLTRAKSSKGATGLMQIMPDTGKWAADKMKLEGYTEEKLYEVDVNIKIGCWYIKELFKYYTDIKLMVAAYNAGFGNVNKWIKNGLISSQGEVKVEEIPFPETKKYVKKVDVYYKIYNYLYD